MSFSSMSQPSPAAIATWTGAVLIGIAILCAPSVAIAEEGAPPTRDEYVERVEPICERNTEANGRILDGARERVKRGELKVAGRQFTRAAVAFGKTVRTLARVPRPPADDNRLMRWLGLMKKITGSLRNVGIALREGNRVRANHEAIRAERNGNAANNAAFAFEFDKCRFDSSKFS